MGMIQKQALENAEQPFSERPPGGYDSKACLLKNVIRTTFGNILPPG